MNDKVIIKIQNDELKKDLQNTKAFDGKEENQERFFISTNFNFGEESFYFDGYEILYFKCISKKLPPFSLKLNDYKKEISNIKNKIICLKKEVKNKKLDLSLKTNAEKKQNDFDKLDYFYYFVYKFDGIKFPKVFFYRYLKDFEFDNLEDLIGFFGINEKVDKFLFNKYLKDIYKTKRVKNVFDNFISSNKNNIYAFLNLLKIIIIKGNYDFVIKYKGLLIDSFKNKYTLIKLIEENVNDLNKIIIEILCLLLQKGNKNDFVKEVLLKLPINEKFHYYIQEYKCFYELLEFLLSKEKSFLLDSLFTKEFLIKLLSKEWKWELVSTPIQIEIDNNKSGIEYYYNGLVKLLKLVGDKDLCYLKDIYKSAPSIELLSIIAKYEKDFATKDYEDILKLNSEKLYEYKNFYLIGKTHPELLENKLKDFIDSKKIIDIKITLKLIEAIGIYDKNFIKENFEKIYKHINIDDTEIKSYILNFIVLVGNDDFKFCLKYIDDVKILTEVSENKILLLRLLYLISQKKPKLLKNFKKQLFSIPKIFSFDYGDGEPEIYDKYSDIFFGILNNLLKANRNFLQEYSKFISTLHHYMGTENYNKYLLEFYYNLYKRDNNFVSKIFTKEDLEDIFINYDDPYNENLPNDILNFIDTKALSDLLVIKPTIYQKQEIQDFIQNYNSGSCLVSGYRGIGKTSLINTCIKEYSENEKEKNIIKISINIPETDENGKLDKKEIINRIIVKIFEEINKNKDIPRKLKKEFFDHYLRVYNDIENKQTITKEYEKGFKFEIKDILSLTIFIIISVFVSLLIGGNFINNFQTIISENYKIILGITSIFGLISSSLFLSYKESNKKEKIIKELYTPDIIESKITNSISCFNKGFTFDNFMKRIKEVLTLEIKKEYIKKFFNFLNPLRFLFYKPIKFIFVIDELDKLLDFEKVIENKKNVTITMKQVFEVLGKLKTLFFDTNGAIFFVVTNKQAYDYYLQNKHQEDDLVSNIFNKIIYLPMNDKENFNLNFQIEVKENTEKEEERISNLSEKLKNYIYFKSHGNWRKARFELSNMLKGNEIVLDKQKFELEYKFYDFFDKLYIIFGKGFLNNTSLEFKSGFSNLIIGGNANLLDDFLFGFNKGYVDKLYNTKEEKEKGFYLSYLKLVKDLIISRNINKNDLLVLNFLEKFIQDFESDKNFKKEYFGYVISSIIKLNEEPAYTDFVLNYLLNIFENIKFIRKTNFKEVFENIQLNAEDYKNLAFTELILYWLPLFLFYFYNTKHHG